MISPTEKVKRESCNCPATPLMQVAAGKTHFSPTAPEFLMRDIHASGEAEEEKIYISNHINPFPACPKNTHQRQFAAVAFTLRKLMV